MKSHRVHAQQHRLNRHGVRILTLFAALALLSALGNGSALAAPAAAPVAEKLTIDLALVGGNLAAIDGLVNKTLTLPTGREVQLRWRSDRPIALHFHGYDIERKVGPDAPATMDFKTTIPGRFPVSEHVPGGGHRQAAVLYIEVQP